MGRGEDILKLFSKSEEVLETLKRGRQFTEELLHENEKLRLRLIQLESQLSDGGGDEIARLRIENEQLMRRVEKLEQRFVEAEAVNRDFQQRHQMIEEENEGLANLFVAIRQLHSTLDPNEVAVTVIEIITNLIGAEEFALYLIDESKNELVFIGGEPDNGRFQRRISASEGLEGRAVGAKSICYGEPESKGQEPLICVPLAIKEELVGVISIRKLLDHKRNFTSLDYELLNVLADHAASALISSSLYSKTEQHLPDVAIFTNSSN